MKLIDLLLLAALVSLCGAVGLVVGAPAALLVFSVGAGALWYLLGDDA